MTLPVTRFLSLIPDPNSPDDFITSTVRVPAGVFNFTFQILHNYTGQDKIPVSLHHCLDNHFFTPVIAPGGLPVRLNLTPGNVSATLSVVNLFTRYIRLSINHSVNNSGGITSIILHLS